MKKIVIIICLQIYFTTLVSAQESLDTLLELYKEESKLSNITKRESAGMLELYTRDELEKMQADTLLDVLKVLPGLILSKSSVGINSLSRLSSGLSNDAGIRLYVNDHEMTSATYGSSFLLWSDMPIEYIDHVEIYKATASIEFGNEVASLIVRVYTKKADREEGSKVRGVVADNGAYDTNIYTAHSMENGLSYFAYANKEYRKRDNYTHTYNDKNYAIKSNKKSHSLFANLSYAGWNLDLGSYAKFSDAYLGAGYLNTPSGDGIDSLHNYMHLSKRFDNDIKVQFSYDYINMNASFVDENYILMSDPNSPGNPTTTPALPAGVWPVQEYNLYLHDTIASVTVEKEFKSEKNRLLLGAFYKHKTFEDQGYFRSDLNYQPPYDAYELRTDLMTNSLDLYSLYFEENYFPDPTTQLVFSMKEDFYRYEKGIEQQNKRITRLGAIKNIKKFQLKAFASFSYIPATFKALYNEENVPVYANPDLNYPKQRILSGSVRYKDQKSVVEAIFIESKVKDAIAYDVEQGYFNVKGVSHYNYLQLSYKYFLDRNNKFYVDASFGDSSGANLSPDKMLMLRSFNRYRKFDFYNELTCLGAYSAYGIALSASYDYTAAVKYHYTEDIAVGIRGENIFKSGYKEVYRNYAEGIAVNDQRFWLNMEVLF